MRVELNGTTVENYRTGSLRLPDEINSRPGGSITFIRNDENFTVRGGELIAVYDEDEALVYSGYISRPRRRPALHGVTAEITCQLLDQNANLDRRTVAETYVEWLGSDIVQDIHTRYLADEGITIGEIDIPYDNTVQKAVFNYVSVMNSFDDLGDLLGANWWVTPNKELYFVSRDNMKAPWSVDEETPYQGLEIETDLKSYRNRQYLRAGQDQTDLQTEQFKGDGETQTFTVGYELALEPTIKVNGVEKEVGIKDVEEGKPWYWNKNKDKVVQEKDNTPLSSSDTLTVDYVGYYPIIVVAEDAEAISDMKEKQGGTGIYESVEENNNIDDSDLALDFAQGKLRKFARINTKVRFRTFERGLKAGQIIPIHLPIEDLDGDFLITKVNVTSKSDEFIAYDVECVDGEDVGGWEKFFKDLAQQNKTFVIRENEVLVRLATMSEKCGWGEDIGYTYYACRFPSTSLYPANDFYPC
ncbi:hypothetical protein [Salibacterium lacus]|uniref:Prophage tail endopeptidase domain-containing protein n=1 Tax=Salibacterium lacus TaxID=1898109 RepID=A0ABW5SWV1_9BACI